MTTLAEHRAAVDQAAAWARANPAQAQTRRARENVHSKAARYLVEGRIAIHRLEGRHVEASARGDGAVYRLGHNRSGWWCDCPARTRCSHLVALGCVVVVKGAP